MTRADVDALLPHVDLLILNDSEAREMTKETSLIKRGRPTLFLFLPKRTSSVTFPPSVSPEFRIGPAWAHSAT